MSAAEEIELLRQTIREAHEATKDLRAEIREARGLARGEIREQIRAEVKREVDQLGEATQRAMRKSVEKVQGEFDKLADILMGRDRASVREGRPPLDEAMQRFVDHENGELT